MTEQALGDTGAQEGDGLGFDTYAQILSNAAISTPGPFTIGIFGEWGTGKTSLMKMISASLKTGPDVIVVWFNAWRYEKEEHPNIIDDLDRCFPDSAIKTTGEHKASISAARFCYRYGGRTNNNRGIFEPPIQGRITALRNSMALLIWTKLCSFRFTYHRIVGA